MNDKCAPQMASAATLSVSAAARFLIVIQRAPLVCITTTKDVVCLTALLEPTSLKAGAASVQRLALNS